ncbi:MAG TPA: hypothetical protein VIC26_14185 [Marinagarivorans sp.]
MKPLRTTSLYRIVQLALSFIVTLCGVGCAHTPAPLKAQTPLPTIDYSAPALFGEPIALETEASLFALTPAQRKDFLAFYNHFLRQNSPGYERVFDYLEKQTRNFEYQTKTYSAAQTLSTLRGDCMSLAVLTTALANAVDDVEIRYQLVDSSPVFYKNSNVVVKGVHVRSKLYERASPGNANQYFTGSSLIIDYLPDDQTRFIGNISREKFLALYYGNRAVESMANEQWREAYWYTREALNYVPHDAANINTMAVIFRRVGDIQKAEAVYRFGIAAADDQLTLLKNYRLLLRSEGRYDEAEQIAQKMADYNDPSPFGWLDAANLAYNEGNYEEAALFYRKSIDAAPYLDYGYFGLARVKYQQGELLDAKRMLIKAMEKTFKEDGRDLYQAKLLQIEREI